MTDAAEGYDFHCHLDLFPDPPAAMASCEKHRIMTLAVTTTPRAWAQNKRWAGGNDTSSSLSAFIRNSLAHGITRLSCSSG